MSTKKSTEEKIQIKGFKDGSSNYWCDTVHYSLNKDGEIVFCAGGIDTQERRDAIQSFVRRNKKAFKERSESIFENEPKEYTEIFTFGKYQGKRVDEFYDVKYLKWLLQNFNFGGKEKLKKEIEEFLKT